MHQGGRLPIGGRLLPNAFTLFPMNLKPAWMLLAAIPLIAMGVLDIQSNGAPMGSTNAPGELTCNRSGCHTGFALNSGGAVLDIDMGGSTSYEPGRVYPVTVTISQNAKERFGFQVLALQDADTLNAGIFIVTDSQRTKTLTGINQFSGRTYMTYKFPGTAPAAPGLGRWSFDWQAPSNDVGPVTFYTAAAAANNDGTDQGDYIYTKTLTIQALPTAAAEPATPHTGFELWPNPNHGRLNLRYLASTKATTSLYLMETATGRSQLLFTRQDQPGEQGISLDLHGAVPSGNYLLCLQQGPKRHCQPLILLP